MKQTIFKLVLLLSSPIMYACSPSSREFSSNDGAVASTGDSMNTMTVTRGVGGETQITYNGKGTPQYTVVDESGYRSYGAHPASAIRINFESGQVVAGTTQNLRVDNLLVTWPAQQPGESARVLRLDHLEIRGSDVIVAQSDQIKSEVDAVLGMSANQRDAYIEQLKATQSIVGNIVDVVVKSVLAKSKN